jgi:hypothetical protein
VKPLLRLVMLWGKGEEEEEDHILVFDGGFLASGVVVPILALGKASSPALVWCMWVQVLVHPRPVVALLSTGDELVEAHQTPRDGRWMHAEEEEDDDDGNVDVDNEDDDGGGAGLEEEEDRHVRKRRTRRRRIPVTILCSDAMLKC